MDNYYYHANLTYQPIKPSYYTRSYRSFDTDIIFNQESIEETYQNRFNIIKKSTDLRDDYTNKQENNITIPPRFFNIHFTYENESFVEIKKINIDVIISNARKTQSIFPGRSYILIVNNLNAVAKYNSLLEQEGIEIQKFNPDYFPHLGSYISKAIEKHEFAKASDIARPELLYGNEYNIGGGFYLDQDYLIYNKELLDQLAHTYSFIVGKDSLGMQYFGNAFIASVAQHPILKEHISIIKRNLDAENLLNTNGICSLNGVDTIPEYIKHPANIFSDVITKTGPAPLTVAFYKANNLEGYNDAALAPGIIFCYPGRKNDFIYGKANEQGLDEFYFDPEMSPKRECTEDLVLGNDAYSNSWVGDGFWDYISYEC